MINRIVKFITSMKFATLLIFLFALSIGHATFIENDFGTVSSKAYIFNTWWFEMMLILLCCSLFLNMFKYNVFRKEKMATLMFHLSFVLILLGAGITRYTGYEGMMKIYEGESENTFISDDVFLQIKVHDNVNEYKLDKKLFLSGITKRFDKTPILKHLKLPLLPSNYFSVSSSGLSEKFTIEYSDFLPNVKDSLVEKNVIRFSIKSKNPELTSESGTNIAINEMITKSITSEESIAFKEVEFTLNNPKDGSLNFQSENGIFKCNAPSELSVMSMPPDGKGATTYMKGEGFEISGTTLITIDSLRFVIFDIDYDGETTLYSSSNIMKDNDDRFERGIDALQLKVKVGDETKEVSLFGKKGTNGGSSIFNLGDLYFTLSYGPKYYDVPFSIRLEDAIVDRYPGTENASSYASEVTVIDGENIFPFRIYMNNILSHRGFRFYQSNIDMENESWTGLSVNHDRWGTIVTYLGYGMLILGIILVFFFKQTRFRQLTQKMKKLKNKTLLVILCLFSNSLFSQNIDIDSLISKNPISIEHADKFSRILVQDNGGRIKPISTLSSEYIRKISRKSSLFGMNPSQVLLGMMSNPEVWSKIPMIKVTHEEILNLVNSNENRVAFHLFFNDKQDYLLSDLVNEANLVIPSKRGKLHKDIIKVDERVNIAYSILNTKYFGETLKMFPIKDDIGNKWDYKIDIPHDQLSDSLKGFSMMNTYLSSVYSSTLNNDWLMSDRILEIMSKYQYDHGSQVIPANYKIEMEVWYNKLNVFSNLFMYYFTVGFILLILLFVEMFYKNMIVKFLIKLFISLVLIGFAVHVSGLISRWIISGHAPWSDGYESMIYIAFATLLSGVIFMRKSPISLAATALVSSMILMVAHLNWLDPEITNLVPVLNSYWLMIHVSLITASYGFLALGALLGFLSLWIMIFTTDNNKNKLKEKIEELTIINEKTITIGLFMLAIGTFLGGIWANESWGRYWGWDPKETWALVSVLVYAFILHMRFIPALRGKYIFNLMTLIGISSIVMTYFGVNYYLSGLHSYAAGDPMPIPVFIYYFVGIVILTGTLAKIKQYNKRKREEIITFILICLTLIYLFNNNSIQ